jgi:hypothetical protein
MPRRKDTKGRSRAPTKAVQAQEIVKCGTSPAYFINRYVKIAHPGRGVIKFDTFPFQDDCLEKFQENRFVIVNKSRQLGLSTICAAYSLWMALFQKEKNILVIATKLETAKLFIRKVEGMLASLPDWLVMPKIKAQSVKYIMFSNGSQVKATPTSKDAGRGEALSLLIVDEAAHVDEIEDLWLGLRPTLSTGGNAILISTPSGVGTLFHKIWLGAVAGEGDFVPIELPWTVHPERDKEWFEKERQDITKAKGERGVAQELLCSFMASGDTFLRPDAMERLFDRTREPIAMYGPAGTGKRDIWVWEHVKTGHRYIISADVARGDGDDYSAFHVINIDEDAVVAEYKGKIAPDKFADLLVEIGMRYNMALICAEKNSVGIATAYKLKEHKYPNLYYEKFHKNVYMVYTTMDIKDETPGLETTVKNRLELIARLETVLRNNNLKVYSKRLYEELQTFVWKGNKPQAQKSYNDDLIMALAIGNSLFEAGGTSTYASDEMAKALLAGMSVATNTMEEGEQQVSPGGTPLPPVMTDGSLNDFVERTKVSQMASGKTHNYNDPFWKQFKWMWDD